MRVTVCTNVGGGGMYVRAVKKFKTTLQLPITSKNSEMQRSHRKNDAMTDCKDCTQEIIC